MSEPAGLIEHLKTRQPATWALLKRAALDGLVVIDEETDAVTATTGFSSPIPDCTTPPATLTNARAERTYDPLTHFGGSLRDLPYCRHALLAKSRVFHVGWAQSWAGVALTA